MNRSRCSRPAWFVVLSGIGVALAALLTPAAAPAQDNPASGSIHDLDDAAFYRGLADWELEPLLETLLDNPPSDPSRGMAQLRQLMGGYLAAQRADIQRWQSTLGRMREYKNHLAANNEDWWGLPTLRADWAQMLVDIALPQVNGADQFTQVAFPGPDQQRAVADLAGEAWQSVTQAQDDLFNLRMRMRRDRGLREDMSWNQDTLNRYTNLVMPLYRAHAAALLLSAPVELPLSEALPDRDGLGDEARRDIQAVLNSANLDSLGSDAAARILFTAGLVALANGEHDAAIERFQRSGQRDNISAFRRMMAGLGQAKAHHRAGRTEDARRLARQWIDRIEQALAAAPEQRDADQRTLANPLYLVMAYDRLFLIPWQAAARLDDPTEGLEQINQAFDVYAELAGTEALGQWRNVVTTFLEQRYAAQIPEGLPEDQLPPAVQLARLRQVVQEEANYADAVQRADTLLGRDGLSDHVVAEARLLKAQATYLNEKPADAWPMFLELARESPDSEQGRRAIRVAYALGDQIYRRAQDRPEVQTRWEDTLRTLINEFPELPQRDAAGSAPTLAELATYDLASLMRQRDRLEAADQAYAEIPEDHPAYVESRYEHAAAVANRWSRATGSQRVELGRRVLELVDAYQQAHEQRRDSGLSGDRQATLHRLAASALLLKGTVLLDRADGVQPAQQVVERIDRSFGDVQAVRAGVNRLRIRIAQRQGDYARAEQLLSEYIQSDPDRAGQLARGVLQSLASEIEQRLEAGRPVEELTEIAVNLADELVLPWVEQRGDLSPAQRLAYAMQPVEILISARQWGDARQRLERIIETFGSAARQNADVVHALGEAHYQLGLAAGGEQRASHFRRARERFFRIIEVSQQNDQYNRLYWRAQLRRFQISDILADGRDSDIFLGIRRLRQRHEDLGGEPFSTQLNRLQSRHDPTG